MVHPLHGSAACGLAEIRVARIEEVIQEQVGLSSLAGVLDYTRGKWIHHLPA